jgi:hypothetical protein
VIRNDSVRRVDAVRVLVSQLAGIRSRARELLDLLEDGGKAVRVVVGRNVVQDRDETLETHSRVHVLGRQRAQGARRLAVVLDENVVPDLEDIGVIGVDEVCGLATTDSIKVDLTAWSARSSRTHLCDGQRLHFKVEPPRRTPEVVLCISGQDVTFRNSQIAPQLPDGSVPLARLQIGLEKQVTHCASESGSNPCFASPSK